MQQLSIGFVFATMALAFGSLAACGYDSPNDRGGPPAGQDGGTANGDGGATPDTGAAGDGGSDSGSAGLGPGPYTPNADRIGLVAHVYTGSGGSPKSVAGAIVS